MKAPLILLSLLLALGAALDAEARPRRSGSSDKTEDGSSSGKDGSSSHADAAAPSQLTEPARITPEALHKLGDLKRLRHHRQPGCLNQQWERLENMKRRYLAGIDAQAVHELRKQQETLRYVLTGQQLPVASNPQQVRGLWVPVRCPESVRNTPPWQQLMDWSQVSEALTRKAEQQQGIEFLYIDKSPAGRNRTVWRHQKTGKLLVPA